MRKLLSCTFLMPLLLYGVYDRPGSTTAQMLKIGCHARAVGMGEAYIAVADDASALYYNPACLARVNGYSMFATHMPWFANINYEYVGMAKSFRRLGTFGVSFGTLYTDKMPVRTILRPEGTGEYFYCSDFVLGLTYATFLTDKTAIGFTLKYVGMYLYVYSAGTICCDIGTYYWTGWHKVRFGMRIANFGPYLKFMHEMCPLPTMFSFGVADEVIETDMYKLTVAVNVDKPTDSKERLAIGCEYWYNDMFAVRAGYKIGHDSETWSTGVGFVQHVGKFRFSINCAYTHYEGLKDVYRLTLGIAI